MSERHTVDFDATQTLPTQPGEEESETQFGVTVVEPERRLRLGEIIGMGGMGEVREAEQQALARRVAVKAVTEGSRSRRATRLLLQEAWITGGLEHPNIVPIHDIDFDDGEPRIVMKHLEGIEWGEVLDDPAARFEVKDPLVWNLGVLIAVCNAVEFAHSRGILHRDLKPENVMIGEYGEVYVLDWGIAVALAPRPDGRIPLAREQTRAAGTPAYMAPEMLTGRGELLSERTDVYLLGGLLYRVVSGRSLRAGRSLEDVLDQVAEGEPIVDPSWPLADLIRAALSRDPEERPPSARAFREALEAHLAHRDALRLVSSGREQLTAMREALLSGRERREIYDLFSAARFAFAEARNRWSEVPGADEALFESTLELARHEIAQGDDRAAQLLIEPLESPPPALTAAIERLRQERESQAAQLQRFRDDASVRTAMVPRIAVAATLASTWVAAPLLSVLLGVPSGYPREFAVSLGIFVATAAVMAVMWPWFLRSQMNRTVLVMFFWMPLLALAFLTAAWFGGLPAQLAGALEASVYLGMLVMGTSLVDWRMGFSIPAYLVTFILGARHPESSLGLLALGNTVVFFNALVVLFSPAFRRSD